MLLSRSSTTAQIVCGTEKRRHERRKEKEMKDIRIPASTIEAPIKNVVTGAAFGGTVLLLLAGVVVSFIIAAFCWWVSDLGYEVSWVVGLPLRLIAFGFALGFFFTVIGHYRS
jgi:hypothetical protein